MNTFGISNQSYELIFKAIGSYPQIERAVIFGSRAKGNYKAEVISTWLYLVKNAQLHWHWKWRHG